MGAGAFPFGGGFTAEDMAEMQRAYLEAQKQQLSQLKQYVAEYAKTLDDALASLDDQIAKVKTSAPAKPDRPTKG
jgi:hypothetical protein